MYSQAALKAAQQTKGGKNEEIEGLQLQLEVIFIGALGYLC